jgi:hypothetical protein
VGDRTHARRVGRRPADGTTGVSSATRCGRGTRGAQAPRRLGARTALACAPRGARRGRGPDVEKAGTTRGVEDAGAGRTVSRRSPRSTAPTAVWMSVNARLTAHFSKNLNRSAPKGE